MELGQPIRSNMPGLLDGAYIGYRSPRRQYQDPEAAKNIPLDVLRGRLAGLLGLLPDVGNIMGRSPMPTEMFGDTQYEPSPQLPYGSEHFLKTLPLAPTSRVGEVAGHAGSFVPLNPMPLVKGAAKAGSLLGQEVNAAIMGERGGLLGAAVAPAQPAFAKPPKDPYKPRTQEQKYRDAIRARESEAERQLEKEYAKKFVDQLPTMGSGAAFNSAQLESVAAYRLAGDRRGALQEGAAQTVNALKDRLKELGVKIVDESSRGGGNSIYAEVNGKLIRISDHELPQTPERLHNKSQGFGGKWDDEIITSNWASTNLDDYINQMGIKEPSKFKYPRQGLLDEAQRQAELLGLPPGNTPQMRADKWWPGETYHGSKTPEGVVETGHFIPGGRPGSMTTGDAYGVGTYTTSAKTEASAPVYAGEGGVFPLRINRENSLHMDNPSAKDLERLTEYAKNNLLPSDMSRFSMGRKEAVFKEDEVAGAREFFESQKKNYDQFGDGKYRNKPVVDKDSSGNFVIRYIDFNNAGDVKISSAGDVKALLDSVGYDEVGRMGYSGLTMNRPSGNTWDVVKDQSSLRSQFAAFDPSRRYSNDLLAGVLPFSLLDEDAPQKRKESLLY